MTAPSIRVWDLPLRLFHWLLAGLVVAAYVTVELGGNWMEWHGRIGLAILGLLIFRLAWGVAGSTHARFSGFFPTPGRLGAYHIQVSGLIVDRLVQIGRNVRGGLSNLDEVRGD